MTKTIYIPRGESAFFDVLSCDKLIVDGEITVAGALTAPYIYGSGVINAYSVSAITLKCGTVNAVNIGVNKLIARRVTATDVKASARVTVSARIRAKYVKAKVVLAGEVDVERWETSDLDYVSGWRRFIIETRLPAYVRSFFADGLKQRHNRGMKRDAAQYPARLPTIPLNAEITEVMALLERSEFRRLIAMQKLADRYGYEWRMVDPSQDELVRDYERKAG
ncbi:MAG: hypothetical protein LBN30_09700 [Oscillospiraceae bacterium]|jgi:hypothetical protein|nr:hypothetical protein [Oscillospiraceae bacterium]